MPNTPINGAADLRNELAAVIRRYIQHLDFDAPTEVTTVKIDATGPGLHIVYAEHDTQSPMLSVSINNYPEPRPGDLQPGQSDNPDEALGRGFLRGR